jgi:mono/diheme cytochrome c family protein
MAHCHKCHPNGEAGLAPGINDKPLPEFLMKTQVRVGLGAMPSFSREQISDQELDDLIRYLKTLRGETPRS